MKRLTSLIVAVLALTVFVGAASASTAAKPKSKRALAEIRRSVEATRDEGSARLEGTISIEGGAQSGEITIDGVVGLEAGANSALTMRAAPELFGQPVDIELRFVDNVLFMEFGDLLGSGGAELPPELQGRPWLKLDVQELVEASEQGAAPPGSSNPAGQLDALRGIAKGSIEVVGNEEVNGVCTTHYQGTVDLSKAAAEVPEEFRAEFDQAFEALSASLSEVPVDVWLDDDGRVRRQQVVLELDQQGQAVEQTVTVDFLEFGVPIDVEAPADDEVITFQEFLVALFAQLDTGTQGAAEPSR